MMTRPLLLDLFAGAGGAAMGYHRAGFDVVPHRGRVAGWRHGRHYTGPYFAVHGDGGGKGTLADWQAAMGIPWMKTKSELAEAIPPAYTRFIGAQLLDTLAVAS